MLVSGSPHHSCSCLRFPVFVSSSSTAQISNRLSPSRFSDRMPSRTQLMILVIPCPLNQALLLRLLRCFSLLVDALLGLHAPYVLAYCLLFLDLGSPRLLLCTPFASCEFYCPEISTGSRAFASYAEASRFLVSCPHPAIRKLVPISLPRISLREEVPS
jgi:hypothetical protein